MSCEPTSDLRASDSLRIRLATRARHNSDIGPGPPLNRHQTRFPVHEIPHHHIDDHIVVTGELRGGRVREYRQRVSKRRSIYGGNCAADHGQIWSSGPPNLDIHRTLRVFFAFHLQSLASLASQVNEGTYLRSSVCYPSPSLLN